MPKGKPADPLDPSFLIEHGARLVTKFFESSRTADADTKVFLALVALKT
jgi:hypothetical protein